jgi:hypothetical protein
MRIRKKFLIGSTLMFSTLSNVCKQRAAIKTGVFMLRQ